jgi:hypothetical protein
VLKKKSSIRINGIAFNITLTFARQIIKNKNVSQGRLLTNPIVNFIRVPELLTIKEVSNYLPAFFAIEIIVSTFKAKIKNPYP